MIFWEVRFLADIKIVAEFDTKAISKEISSLEKDINKLSNKQLPLIREFEELQHKVALAKKEITDADKALAAGKIDKVDRFTINQQATQSIQTYTAKIEELRGKIEGLDNQIMPMKEQLESLKFTGSPDNSIANVGTQAKANLASAAEAADRMTKSLSSAKSQSDNLGKSASKINSSYSSAASGMKSKMSSALKSVEGSFGNFGKRISSTIKSAFIFSTIYKGLSELKNYLSAMLGTNQQFVSSLNMVKSNLAVAFQPIYQAAMPAIQALLDLLVKASAYLAAFTNALFGTSMNSSIAAAREMQSSIAAAQSGASGASAAEKELTAAIKEKQSQVKALQRENKNLQREYEQEKKAVEAQTDALEDQISALEKEISAIQKAEAAANSAAASQRNMIQANISMLQEQQKALQRVNEEQQKIIDKQISGLQRQQKSLTDTYNSRSKAIDSQINALQDRQDALRERQKAETDAIDSEIKGINKQIKAIQKAQKEAEKAKKANQKFTASFDELSTLGTIEEEDPYDIEIEKLQEQIDILQEKKEAVNDSYEAQIDAIQDSVKALQEQKEAYAESYESENASIQRQIESLQNKKQLLNEAYDEQNAKIQEQIDLLQKQQDSITDFDYSSKIEAYEEKIAAIREQIDALNDSLEENPQIEQNELLIEKLQEEIDLLQEQKDAIDNSSGAASAFKSAFSDALTDAEEKIKNSALGKWLDDNREKIFEIGGILLDLAPKILIAYGAFNLFSGLLAIAATPGGALLLAAIALGGFVLIFGDTEAAIESLEKMLDGFNKFLTGVFTGDLELALEGIEQVFQGFFDFVEQIFIAIDNFFVFLLERIKEVEEKLLGIELDSDYKEQYGYKYGSSAGIPNNNVNNWRTSSETSNDIPALASGAVLPPNKPFYAMLGDQKNGTNLEAPASLIEDIMRKVMSEQQFNFNVIPRGSLGALIRLLNLEFVQENERETVF